MNEVMVPKKVNKKNLKGFFDKHALIAPILLNLEDRK
jgi:hypothetical protein